MRHKRLKLRVLVLLGFGLSGLQGQTMNGKESSSTQRTYALRYLNFSNNTINVDGQFLIQSELISAYSNPASNVLNIDLSGAIDAKCTKSIIGFDGKIIISQQITNEGIISLDVDPLPKGIYLCRYSILNETKTVKIIQQYIRRIIQ